MNSQADGAPRITVDELKRRMDEGGDVAILDMRKGSWERSDVKIAGAVRMHADELEEHDPDVPPGAEIVTYCT